MFETDQTGECLEIRRSAAGRVAGAVARFAVWMPVGMAALSILFLPDYLGQYREQEPVPGLFWAVLGAISAFVALIGALVKFLRRDLWVVDAEADRLVFETHPLVGTPSQGTVELDRLERVVLERGDRWEVSAVGFELRGYPNETLGRTRLGGAELDKLVDTIESFVDEHELEIEIARKGASS